MNFSTIESISSPPTPEQVRILEFIKGKAPELFALLQCSSIQDLPHGTEYIIGSDDPPVTRGGVAGEGKNPLVEFPGLAELIWRLPGSLYADPSRKNSLQTLTAVSRSKPSLSLHVRQPYPPVVLSDAQVAELSKRYRQAYIFNFEPEWAKQFRLSTDGLIANGDPQPREPEVHTKQPSSAREAASVETTKRAARVPNVRAGKRGMTIYLDPQTSDDLSAVAALKRMGKQEYVEYLIERAIAANIKLLPEGREKLSEPKRFRPRTRRPTKT